MIDIVPIPRRRDLDCIFARPVGFTTIPICVTGTCQRLGTPNVAGIGTAGPLPSIDRWVCLPDAFRCTEELVVGKPQPGIAKAGSKRIFNAVVDDDQPALCPKELAALSEGLGIDPGRRGRGRLIIATCLRLDYQRTVRRRSRD